MSPEVISARPYTSASDIWALGCVLYEAAARTPAFAAKGLPQVGLCGGGGVRGLGVSAGQGEGAEKQSQRACRRWVVGGGGWEGWSKMGVSGA